MICKILYGSHLYGLDTPESDTDYKGVFLPTKMDLILQRAPRHQLLDTNKSSKKNTSEDVDFEMFSLHKFLDLVGSGQPMAIEMMFAPKSCVMSSSPVWEEIVKNRKRLLTSKIGAFTGYCRGQASKYCTKGDRLASLDYLIETFNFVYSLEAKLEVGYDELCDRMEGKVGFEKIVNTKGVKAFKMLGKEYCCNTKIGTIKDSLDKNRSRYGNRTEKAMDGADWKALSHAVRIAVECIEVLTYGHLTLPLREEDRKYILDIKKGMVRMGDVEDKLTELLNLVDVMQVGCRLPDKFDRTLADNIIISQYWRD